MNFKKLITFLVLAVVSVVGMKVLPPAFAALVHGIAIGLAYGLGELHAKP